MNQYGVRYLPEAITSLREAFVYIREDSGDARASDWLREVYASIEQLETTPRATRDEGQFYGRELRSKLVMSHRVFFTIDEAAQVVYVVDLVHTARQNKLDEYSSEL